MKAILYCRKSSESEDRQEKSLDAQEYELRLLAEREGIEIVEALKESMSAKAPGRPIFAKMLSSLSEGKADSILCWKLDRLARNPVDSGAIGWMLQQNKIKEIKTYERSYYPSDNVLLMSVEFGMSNQYIRDLSENVKRGNREKVRRGEWPNRAPYGYRNDKNTRTLKIVKTEADKVRQVFELYVTGKYSMNDLAKKFGFRKSLIERILKRHAYYGMIEYHEELYPGIHKPIVSKRLFDQAQEIKHGVTATKPRLSKLKFPYRGFMKCAVCSCQLTATRKKGAYDYYYCTNGKGFCSEHKTYLTDKTTHSLFIEALKKLQFDEELIELIYEASRERHENGRYSGQQTLDTIQYQIHQLKLKKKKLLYTFTSGLVEEDLYTEEASELQKEKKELEAKYRNYENNADNGLATLELTKKLFLDSNRALFDFENGDPEKKQKVAQNLLWNFEVKDKKALNHKFKFPYNLIANAPKSGDLAVMLLDRDSNPDRRHQKP